VAAKSPTTKIVESGCLLKIIYKVFSRSTSLATTERVYGVSAETSESCHVVGRLLEPQTAAEPIPAELQTPAEPPADFSSKEEYITFAQLSPPPERTNVSGSRQHTTWLDRNTHIIWKSKPKEKEGERPVTGNLKYHLLISQASDF